MKTIDIETIKTFYALMQDTVTVRRVQVERLLKGDDPDQKATARLRSTRERLLEILGDHDGYDYEIDELDKDLIFLEKGTAALLAHLDELHPGFNEELHEAGRFLAEIGHGIRNFISDRDGTVNNYCGRYLSSVQSAYNALFLSRFSLSGPGNSVILSSAPLQRGGLEDVSAAPQRLFVLAGSKGREYLDRGKRRGRLPVDKAKQKKLDQLNRRLEALLRDPRYQVYALIGSGLQFKFGQTTVARQDIYGSIPQSESREFMSTVQQLIGEIDPADEIFRIEDTGKDIEIILTVEGEEGLKDFDKGDGVLFLDRELELNLSKGTNLVCGDTSSDIPMVAAASGRSVDTWTIFVTREDLLKEKVRRVCRHAFFVSEPDVLVTVLKRIGGKHS